MGVAADDLTLWLLLPAPPGSHPFVGGVSGGFPQKPQHQPHMAEQNSPMLDMSYSPKPETWVTGQQELR